MQTDNFLVNDNVAKDTAVINSFTDWHVFENLFLKNKGRLEKNATVIEIDARYDYRPDLLAYDQYQEEFYYPAILIVNNLGSMLQFKSAALDNQCKIPSLASIVEIIRELPEQTEE